MRVATDIAVRDISSNAGYRGKHDSDSQLQTGTARQFHPRHQLKGRVNETGSKVVNKVL